jgi:hypothetical protein
VQLGGKELGDNFEMQDLIALPNRSFFVRLLVHGQYVEPFSAKTIEVPDPKAATPPSPSSDLHVQQA